jgi:hypothetical protein
MALTLSQGAQLAADVLYAARVRSAMVRAAISVSSEVQAGLSSNAWAKRRQLATRILNGPDSMLASFVAAVAADQASSLSWFAPVAIASSSNANPIVITTSASHGYVNGDVVEVVDHLVNTRANGAWTVTNLTATTFSVPMAGNGLGTASGYVMKAETDANVAFTVNSVFSAVAGLAPGE